MYIYGTKFKRKSVAIQNDLRVGNELRKRRARALARDLEK